MRQGTFEYMRYTNGPAPCADPESFVRGGPAWTTFFF